MDLSEELSRKEQIEKFLNSNKTKTQLHDVSVKEMRHNIPLLLMEVYSEKYGSYTKKVKGLWEKRPDDWPGNVPFVDPNNKLKNEGEKNCKPKKELLGQMLNHLIKQYKEKQEYGPDIKLAPIKHILCDPDFHESQINLRESDEPEYGLIADSLDQHQMVSAQFSTSSAMTSGSYCSVNQTSGFDFDHDICGFDDNLFNLDSFETPLFVSLPDQVEPIRSPEQAMDNEDANMGDDWNPLTELVQRIAQKIGFVKKRKFLSGADLLLTEARYKKLKEAATDPADHSVIIDDLHALEKEIDVLRFSKKTTNNRLIEMPSDQNNQILTKSDDSKMSETVTKCVEADPCTEPPMEVPVAVEDPALMNSLNIKTRHGVPQPSGTVGNLSIRSVPGLASEAQNASSLKASALSECCKPVQPADEDFPGFNELLYQQDLADFPFGPETETLVPIEDDLSGLNISDNHEDLGRIFTPVQETDTTCLAVSNAGQVNAISVGNPVAPVQIMITGVGNQGIEGGRAVVSGPELLKFLHQLMQQNRPTPTAMSPTPQPSVATQQKPFSLGLQPRAANNYKPGGKRGYSSDDDDDDDVIVVEEKNSTCNRAAPNQESGFGTMIPTMVEEMSVTGAPSVSRFPKKSRRTT